jgi:hypothetical protein
MPDDDDLTVVPLLSPPVVVFMASGHRPAGQEHVRLDARTAEVGPGRGPSVPLELAASYWLRARTGHRPRVTEETALIPDECWPLIRAGKATRTSPRLTAERSSGLRERHKAELVSWEAAPRRRSVRARPGRRPRNTDLLVLRRFDVATERAGRVTVTAA